MKLNVPPVPNQQQPTGLFLRGMEWHFVVIFLLLFFGLQYGYSACQGTIVEHVILDVATVQPSAAAINLISPDANAQANGHRIVSPHGSLSVLNGCEGTETLFLLLAAIAAFKAPWKHKLKGAVIGTFIIYGLNQGRIVALFFAAQQDRKWFDMLHGTIAPTLIIVVSVLFFLWWSSGSSVGEQERAA